MLGGVASSSAIPKTSPRFFAFHASVREESLCHMAGLHPSPALPRGAPDPIGSGAPLGSAGLGWSPAMWHNDSSLTDAWNAKNLGEVFGIALDDATPPNIYVTATSI